MRKLRNNELNRLSIKEFKQTKKSPLIVVLDNVRSMNNIGSVFRSCDAFIAEAIYLCGITATPPHKDIHKTALGSTDSVHWEYFEHTMDAIVKLKSKGYNIISIEQVDHSVSLENFIPDHGEKYAVIFGNEVKGVEQKIVDASDFCIEIPQFGTKHSLNISVSAGIVIWEFFKKLRLNI